MHPLHPLTRLPAAPPLLACVFVCVSQNLIRGRGLFCRSLMKSQAASPGYSPVYAALVAVVNTKFPELGELLLSRLILQVRGKGRGREGKGREGKGREGLE